MVAECVAISFNVQFFLLQLPASLQSFAYPAMCTVPSVYHHETVKSRSSFDRRSILLIPMVALFERRATTSRDIDVYPRTVVCVMCLYKIDDGLITHLERSPAIKK